MVAVVLLSGCAISGNGGHPDRSLVAGRPGPNGVVVLSITRTGFRRAIVPAYLGLRSADAAISPPIETSLTGGSDEFLQDAPKSWSEKSDFVPSTNPWGQLNSRSTTLSQLPLIREINPEFRATQWIGLVGPRGMPEAIVSKLNGTLKEVLQLPQVKEKLAAFGAEVLESTPEDFEKFLSYEPAKWKRIIQENGIKLPQ